MKSIIIPLLLISFSATSSEISDDPYEVFDISKRMTSSIKVEIHTDDNAPERCQRESRRRGFGGWPYKVFACSFWNEENGHKCSVYLPKNTNMHQLGHEIRHCYQGAWHS